MPDQYRDSEFRRQHIYSLRTVYFFRSAHTQAPRASAGESRDCSRIPGSAQHGYRIVTSTHAEYTPFGRQSIRPTAVTSGDGCAMRSQRSANSSTGSDATPNPRISRAKRELRLDEPSPPRRRRLRATKMFPLRGLRAGRAHCHRFCHRNANFRGTPWHNLAHHGATAYEKRS